MWHLSYYILLRILQPTAYKEKYNNSKCTRESFLLMVTFSVLPSKTSQDSRTLAGWVELLPTFQAIPTLSKCINDLQGTRGTAPSSGSACLCVYVWVQGIFLFSALTCKFPKADRCEGALCFLGVQTRKNRVYLGGGFSLWEVFASEVRGTLAPSLALVYPYHV